MLPPFITTLVCSIKNTGVVAEAETQLHDVLRLRADYPEAQLGLALICLKEGHRDEAITHLK
jgi:Flp pilus assembly protein TadD